MRYLFYCICFFLTIPLYAQEDGPNDRIPNWALKSKPLGWASPVRQKVDLGIEKRFYERWSGEAVLGFVYTSPFYVNFEGEQYRGPYIQLAGRYYFNKGARTVDFLGIGLRALYIDHERYRQYLRLGDAYTQWMFERRSVRQESLFAAAGTRIFMGSGKRFFLDLNGRFDFVKSTVSIGTVPPDAVVVRENFVWGLEEGIHVHPNLAIEVALGFSFR